MKLKKKGTPWLKPKIEDRMKRNLKWKITMTMTMMIMIRIQIEKRQTKFILFQFCLILNASVIYNVRK